MTIPVVGLTGGIASGKSTIAGMFTDCGVPVIDADALAREVVAKGTSGLEEVKAKFGDSYILPDGNLDRKKLGKLIFQDEVARNALNAIVHPHIAKLSQAKIATLNAAKTAYVIYEAALIVENQIHKTMFALIVVAVDENVQIKRLMQRDNLTEEDARSRLRAQAPLSKKINAADYVIQNSGTLDDTRNQVLTVHHDILHRLKTKTP